MFSLKLLVTGGTGVLGRAVVQAAKGAGHAVRIGSRRGQPAGEAVPDEWAQMDLATGHGVPAALAGVECVVHTATDPRQADAVDVNGTRHLLAAARSAGVGHVLYVSIVGVERIPLGYYRRKLAAEDLVASSGVPYSILRATQFHSLLDLLFRAAARVPLVMPLPTTMRIQSVSPSDVAERIVRCVANGPGQRLAGFGGPEVLTLHEAAAQWKAARSVRKPVIHLPLPGSTARAFRRGENTAPDGDHGTTRWRDWLRGSKPNLGGESL